MAMSKIDQDASVAIQSVTIDGKRRVQILAGGSQEVAGVDGIAASMQSIDILGAREINEPSVVRNGTFTKDLEWTKGEGWSISGGHAVRESAAFGSLLSQAVELDGAATYQITFDVIAISGGSVNTRFYGTSTQVGASKSDTGQYTTTLSAANNTTFAVGVSAAGVTATIDNIRVVPT